MEFNEIFDAEKLELILKYWEVIAKNKDDNNDIYDPVKICKTYLKSSQKHKDNINKIKIHYTQKKNGRFYADKGISLQSFKRCVRQTITNDYYYDIDIKNCIPSILCQWLNKNNFKCEKLSYYVKNRDDIINDLIKENNNKYDKDFFKIAFISLINGCDNYIKSKLPFIKEFENELKHIHEFIKFKCPTIEEDEEENTTENKTKKKTKSKENNKNIGQIINYLICNIENNILQTMIKYLHDNQIIKNNLVMMFDGFQILKKNVKDIKNLLIKLMDEVKNKLDYDIVLVNKKMDEIINIDELLKISNDDLLKIPIPNNCSYERILNSFNNHVIHIKTADYLYYNLYNEQYEPVEEARLKHIYNHLITSNYEDKTGNKIPFIDVYLKTEHSKNYKYAIEFAPPPNTVNNDEIFNLYTGLEIEKNKYKHEKNIDISPWLNHLKILCNNEDETFNYILKWLAHLIQKPGELNNIATCFKSGEGSGKNIFFNHFQKYIIGYIYCFETSDPENTIFSRFNSCQMNKLFTVINEATSSGCYKNCDRLKDLITAEKLNIEFKGKTTITIKNYCRYLFTTNNNNVFNITLDDRRFVLVKCSDEKKGDKEYFNNLSKWLNSYENSYSVYNYLKSIDINDFNWIKERPITELYKDNIKNNLDSFTYFLKNLYCEKLGDDYDKYLDINKFLEFKITYTPTELFNKFIEYCKTFNHKTEIINDKRLAAIIKDKYNFITSKISNGKKYIIDFNSVREYLDKHNLLDKIENTEKLKVENYKTCRFTEDEKEDKEDQENKINLIDIDDFEPKIKTTKKATKKTSK